VVPPRPAARSAAGGRVDASLSRIWRLYRLFWFTVHYYLGAIIATIPVPFVFEKDHFKSGVATKVLMDYAEDPHPSLDEAAKKKMSMVQSDLLRKFTDIAFDESAKVRWRELQRQEVTIRTNYQTQKTMCRMICSSPKTESS
jgi:hypothetical protein